MSNHTYFTSHGIRTKRKEVDLLEKNFQSILNKRKDDGDVHHCSYGHIPAWCLIPPLGSIINAPIIFMARRQLERLSRLYKTVIVILYSNGTWVGMRAIENSKKINNNLHVILFGSTLRCSFDFTKLEGKVRTVTNFCSVKDNVIRFFPRLINMGNAGYYGFRTFEGMEANVEIKDEKVWTPDEAWDRSPFPQVTNIHHNTVSHSGWFETDKYIMGALDRVIEKIKVVA